MTARVLGRRGRLGGMGFGGASQSQSQSHPLGDWRQARNTLEGAVEEHVEEGKHMAMGHRLAVPLL